MPKRSVDSQLEEGGDQAAEIMAEDLAQNLVDLRGRRLSANAGAKLGLNHVERRLHIRPLVVVLKELFAMISEEVVHTLPPSAALWGNAPRLSPIRSAGVVVRLERDKRKRTRVDDSIEVGVGDISAVSGDGLDAEPLRRGVEERG